jgi:hypothetical protein
MTIAVSWAAIEDGHTTLDSALDQMLQGARGVLPGTRSHGGRHLGRVANADGRSVAVQRLLDELCDDVGFCLPPLAEARLQQAPPLDAESLTDAVFLAGGMDPRLYPYLRREVRVRVDRWLPAIARPESGHLPGP